MNRSQKMKLAKELFTNTSMTKEQYEEFKLLVKDLDLVIADTEEWGDIEKQLENDFKPHYINPSV